jgi:hypothetical protein
MALPARNWVSLASQRSDSDAASAIVSCAHCQRASRPVEPSREAYRRNGGGIRARRAMASAAAGTGGFGFCDQSQNSGGRRTAHRSRFVAPPAEGGSSSTGR